MRKRRNGFVGNRETGDIVYWFSQVFFLINCIFRAVARYISLESYVFFLQRAHARVKFENKSAGYWDRISS